MSQPKRISGYEDERNSRSLQRGTQNSGTTISEKVAEGCKLERRAELIPENLLDVGNKAKILTGSKM